MFRRLFAFLVILALAAGEIPTQAAGVSAIGVVTQAYGANLARASVSTGATVFDGDSLSTAPDGLLRVRAGAARLYLAGQSSVKLSSAPNGTLAQLTGGTLVFSSARAAAMDIEVAQAHIRPTSDQPTVAQVSVGGGKTIDVRATRGSLEFSYNGETQLVPEGAAYRFVLDPSDEAINSAVPPAFPDQKAPRGGGRRRKGFLYFIIGATAVLTYVAVDEALESPNKP